MKKPSVEIVIVCYNQESLIKETLESVIDQSYDNITKIIVADDGSVDNSPKIIKDMAIKNPLIKPILAKKNKGISYNVNRGLKHVNANFVAVIGGDDIFHPHKIEKQVDYLVRNENMVACAHDMVVYDTIKKESIGKFSEIISYKRLKGNLNIKKIFDPALFLCSSSFLYRSDKIPKNGFDIRLKYLNDFLFNVEVLVKGNIGYLNKELGTYRVHGNNITSNSEATKMAFEDSLIAFSIIISRYPNLVSIVKKRKQAIYMNQILKNIKEGKKNRAKMLSKVLISEGSMFKGTIGYIISIFLSKDRIDKIYQNRRLLRFFTRFF